MNRSLVLACGNSQRGDDGVALQILDCLREAGCDPATEFHFQQQWTPELAEPISQAETVIFVDAAVGTPPGSVAFRRLQARPRTPQDSTHYMSPEYLLQLAQEVYGSHPVRAYLVTVTGLAFDSGETLCEPVRRAIPFAGQQIRALLSAVTIQEDEPAVCPQ
jgi:hydrogenase maturation protease